MIGKQEALGNLGQGHVIHGFCATVFNPLNDVTGQGGIELLRAHIDRGSTDQLVQKCGIRVQNVDVHSSHVFQPVDFFCRRQGAVGKWDSRALFANLLLSLVG